MAEVKRIVIDAGHGGEEPGAIYQGRREKDDNLRLALAVGQILSQAGQQVGYTRVTDVYQSPYEKAAMANNAGAEYFISFHRNAMPVPGSASGSASLVYSDSGVPGMMAENINPQMAAAGFTNLGTIQRPGLVVLRDTQMPSVLLEVGFIDNQADNRIFDQNFDQLANGIAQGILATIEQEEMPPQYYQVQVAAYRDQAMANQMAEQLKNQDLPAFVISQDGWFRVRVGAYLNLDNAARMEQVLRNMGYSTIMVREAEMS